MREELFICWELGINWDVSQGMDIVGDGRSSIPIPLDTVAGSVRTLISFVRRFQPGDSARVNDEPKQVRFDSDHALSTDPSDPGIAAVVLGFCILIDGNHRLERARQLGGTRFRVRLLTEDEARQCVTKHTRDEMDRLERMIREKRVV